MLINQVAYSCSQRGRQASNEECKQALLLPCVNDSRCKQAMKKSKQAAFYCVSVTATRNVFFAYVMLYLKQVFMYAKH